MHLHLFIHMFLHINIFFIDVLKLPQKKQKCQLNIHLQDAVLKPDLCSILLALLQYWQPKELPFLIWKKSIQKGILMHGPTLMWEFKWREMCRQGKHSNYKELLVTMSAFSLENEGRQKPRCAGFICWIFFKSRSDNSNMWYSFRVGPGHL